MNVSNLELSYPVISSGRLTNLHKILIFGLDQTRLIPIIDIVSPPYVSESFRSSAQKAE